MILDNDDANEVDKIDRKLKTSQNSSILFLCSYRHTFYESNDPVLKITISSPS